MIAMVRAPLSESVQMYLVSIARLRRGEGVVPLSELADELSVSPVSANEMCHKMQDQGLVIYQPYKGVLLTEEGKRRALYVLRRHRLWEVFLVSKLGLAYAEAHEAACQLEHDTPDEVVERLDAYLGQPDFNPMGDPIPGPDGALPLRHLAPLCELGPGQRGHVVRCDTTDLARAFLDDHGLRSGAWVTVIATTESGLLIDVEGTEMALATHLAERIHVEPEARQHE